MAEKLVKALTELKEKEVLDMVQELLESGKKPMEIVDSSRIAMEEVGKRFESGEYFIPDLIFAGEILKRVSEIVKPEMEEEAGAEKIGKVIIGTVEGDIHDIGKNIVTFMMDINGFEVIDLGVDVPPYSICRIHKDNPYFPVSL
jgi:methanogenic corrinoid protein MtbC1